MSTKLLIAFLIVALLCIGIGAELGWNVHRIYYLRQQHDNHAAIIEAQQPNTGAGFEDLTRALLADAVILSGENPSPNMHRCDGEPPFGRLHHPGEPQKLDLDLPWDCEWSQYLPSKEPAYTTCKIAVEYVIDGAQFVYSNDEDLLSTQFRDLEWTNTEQVLRDAKIGFREPEKARDLLLKVAQYGLDKKYLFWDNEHYNSDNLATITKQCRDVSQERG